MKHNPIVESYCGCSVSLCAVHCDMSNLCNLMKAVLVSCFWDISTFFVAGTSGTL